MLLLLLLLPNLHSNGKLWIFEMRDWQNCGWRAGGSAGCL
jgi:hypothetical protein